MNQPRLILALLLLLQSSAMAQSVAKDLAYLPEGHARHRLDIYRPKPAAKPAPVLFWIHGGGWVTGDKSSVQEKPAAFASRGWVFVSTNYRLLPEVSMGELIEDVAKSLAWVRGNIAAHGGDPEHIVVAGHSAGAQLAALLCTDERYLKALGVPLSCLKGCIPVDGDTYDVPAMIETAENRRRVHGLPQATFGHREKFGNDAAKHRDFSAVTHIAKGRSTPPFFILHVADHPDNSAQAQRLANTLRAAGVPTTVFAAKETNHTRINAHLGLEGDPATVALWKFLGL